MISLINKLPPLDADSAELIKIKCLYDSYKNDDKVLFWVQNNNNAIISMTDGNMIIWNNNADFIELKEDAQEKDLEEALIKNITKVLKKY